MNKNKNKRKKYDPILNLDFISTSHNNQLCGKQPAKLL
jgi:hypothetical protein